VRGDHCQRPWPTDAACDGRFPLRLYVPFAGPSPSDLIRPRLHVHGHGGALVKCISRLAGMGCKTGCFGRFSVSRSMFVLYNLLLLRGCTVRICIHDTCSRAHLQTKLALQAATSVRSMLPSYCRPRLSRAAAATDAPTPPGRAVASGSQRTSAPTTRAASSRSTSLSAPSLTVASCVDKPMHRQLNSI